MQDSDERKRFRFGCRRGMLELDILLLNFFDECYDDLTKAQQKNFQALLESDDPDLYAWLMDYQVPPMEFSQIIERIRNHARTRTHY